MVCTSPLKGYYTKDRSKNGKRGFTFNPKKGYIDRPLTISCGNCIGCRLQRSREWAIRCVHEASNHSNNCFITLTYNNENLPKNGTLVKEHMWKFFKDLRAKYGKGIRFYQCGEYGENLQRPHYHALIFNHDFSDKKFHHKQSGNTLYTSESLEKLWGRGFCLIGEVTFESAQYVARYILKKITGELADTYYNDVCMYTGEILNTRIPEYVNMSRREGIGKKWIKEYMDDTYKDDFVILKSKKMKPPRYYDKIFDLTNEEEFYKIKMKRIKEAHKRRHDNTDKRLKVKEICLKAKLKNSVRRFER